MPLASIAQALMVLLVETEGGGWAPGIGDPTIVGWVTVAAYFYGAHLCYRAFARASTRAAQEPRLSLTWLVLCVGLLLLGVNKQLDLQSLLTVIGRRLARGEGWYERRGTYQLWFIRSMLIAALAGSVTVSWVLRRHLKDLWLAAVGGVMLLAFVVIRAASFHHVDSLINHTWLGMRLNGILELSGIGFVALSAARFLRRGAR